MTMRALVDTPYAAAMILSREHIIDEILASKAHTLYDIGRALPPFIIHKPVGYVGQVCRHPLSKLIEIHPIFINSGVHPGQVGPSAADASGSDKLWHVPSSVLAAEGLP